MGAPAEEEMLDGVDSSSVPPPPLATGFEAPAEEDMLDGVDSSSVPAAAAAAPIHLFNPAAVSTAASPQKVVGFVDRAPDSEDEAPKSPPPKSPARARTPGKSPSPQKVIGLAGRCIGKLSKFNFSSSDDDDEDWSPHNVKADLFGSRSNQPAVDEASNCEPLVALQEHGVLVTGEQAALSALDGGDAKAAVVSDADNTTASRCRNDSAVSLQGTRIGKVAGGFADSEDDDSSEDDDPMGSPIEDVMKPASVHSSPRNEEQVQLEELETYPCERTDTLDTCDTLDSDVTLPDATTEADNALDGAAQQPADDAMLPDQGRPDEAETVMDEAESEQVGDVEQLETGSEEANAQASECEWVQCYDETSHSNYYFNQITQATQWEAPEVYTKLPWEEQLDEGSGRMYYVNAMTGITQWEIPNEGFALYHAEIEESPLPEVAEQDECEDSGWQPVNAGSGATETEGSGCEIPDGSQLGVEDHVAEGETAELVNEDAEPSTVDAKTTEPANADADTVESDNAASLDLRDSSESQPADIDTADTPEAENSANRKAAAEQKKQQRLEATKERKRRAKEKLYGRNRPSIEEEAEHRSKVGMEPNRAGTSILSDPYAFQPPPPSPPLEESSPRSTMITKSPRGKDRASKERSPRLAGLSGQYVDHMTGQTVSQSTTVNESSGPQDPQSNIKMLDLSMFSLMDKKEEDENVDK